jgi:hypothetical protein
VAVTSPGATPPRACYFDFFVGAFFTRAVVFSPDALLRGVDFARVEVDFAGALAVDLDVDFVGALAVEADDFAGALAVEADDFADGAFAVEADAFAGAFELELEAELAVRLRVERFSSPMGSALPTALTAPVATPPTVSAIRPAVFPAVRPTRPAVFPADWPTRLTTLPGSGIGRPPFVHRQLGGQARKCTRRAAITGGARRASRRARPPRRLTDATVCPGPVGFVGPTPKKERPMRFHTTILQTGKTAAGIEVPPEVVEKSIDALKAGRIR